METNVLSGLLLILLAGSCSGVFSVPFKFNRGWAWENNWFIWSFAALLVMPWLMAWLTVPRLGTLYGADPHSTSLVALFGLTWGVGAILFGKGIDYLGISLSLPIMQGLINSIGTLMPIVLRDPSELATPAGLRISWPASYSSRWQEAGRSSRKAPARRVRSPAPGFAKDWSSACWPVYSAR